MWVFESLDPFKKKKKKLKQGSISGSKSNGDPAGSILEDKLGKNLTSNLISVVSWDLNVDIFNPITTIAIKG